MNDRDELTDTGADSAVYKTLLESTKAIPWKIDWATKCFSYIGPQIESVLGWPRDSWSSVHDWVQRMHPDDRDFVFNYCVQQSLQGLDHEADYRALTKAGEYVWIRDVVHVVRKGEEVEALIGFMFDITERKRMEEELVQMHKELEALSYKDGLTGVANRRMFDSVMELEWTNAHRNRQPLSLIFLDIDYFKQYNDCYGHLQGDDCLKQIAQALNAAATRAHDFFGRFGGEEFVIVLPETDASAAAKVAERCRNLVFKLQIPHAHSAVSQNVTISLGVGTVIPEKNSQMHEFIESVDRRLYLAKQRGRNCAESG